MDTKGMRVLVIEDSSTCYAYLESQIYKVLGECTVDRATTLQEAEAAVNGHSIIFCDLHLPDGDGPAVVELCRRMAPRTPLIVISRCTEFARACGQAGADAFLDKSLTEQQLEPVIQCLIGRAVKEGRWHTTERQLRNKLIGAYDADIPDGTGEAGTGPPSDSMAGSQAAETPVPNRRRSRRRISKRVGLI